MNKNIKTILILFAVSGLLSLMMFAGVLKNADLAVSDSMYQEEQAQSGLISVVGIDERSMAEYGPYQSWDRSIVTSVIRKLNASEDMHPAIIGVDVIYSGETDPELDRALAEAAGEYGNVVMASTIDFGTVLSEQADGSKKLLTDVAAGYYEPYPELKSNCEVGYVNALLDSDGIIRHHLLQTTLTDGEGIRSFAGVISEKLAALYGFEIELPQTDGRGLWYLPFTAGPGGYDEGISVASILNDEIPPEYLAGRIVLIGPYAAGLQDQYTASIDHAAPIYGVEIQANAIEAMLNGEYKKEAADIAQLFIIWGIIFACSLSFLKKDVRIETAVWAAAVIIWYLICRTLGQKGLMLHPLWIPAPLTVMYIGFVAIGAVQSMMEKRKITNMFSHYVAPEVVKELIRLGPEGLQLGGRVADIAVLFVDVRGFTTMSEALSPTEVVAILNDYLTLITDCVLRHGGTLDKFVGDAAMAVWGSPLPVEDSAMKAVNAGIDMVKGSEELSKTLMEKYGRTVAFGIGVNYGEAVVGNMGSAIHMDYTAIGDTVNTAARLEANAPGGHVYISRAVADQIGDRISFVSLGGTIHLKGKKDGFEVLDLTIPD